MIYVLVKAAISGAIVAAASEVARRWPGIGGLIVSLPLVSLLAIVWLWRDTGEAERVAAARARHLLVLPAVDAAVPGCCRQCCAPALVLRRR